MKHIYHRPQVKEQFTEAYKLLGLIREKGYKDTYKDNLDKAMAKLSHLENTPEYMAIQNAATKVLANS